MAVPVERVRVECVRCHEDDYRSTRLLAAREWRLMLLDETDYWLCRTRGHILGGLTFCGCSKR